MPLPPTQHVLIIGPGLGRSDHTQNCARAAFELAKESDIGVVVDADGLFLVAVSRRLTIRYARMGEPDNIADVREVDTLLVVCLERPFGHPGLAWDAPSRLDTEHHGIQAVMRKDGQSRPAASPFHIFLLTKT